MNENLKTVTHLKVLLALATAAGTLRATSFGFACVLICEMIFSCVAAPGDIDPSFDFGSGIDGPVKAALIQSDGKILIAGAFTTINGLVRPSVARLSADGQSDESFGLAVPLKAPVTLLLEQQDGKILVGETYPLGEIERLNRDGSIDDSFKVQGTHGIVDSLYRLLALYSDGRILASGYSITERLSKVVRLHRDGLVDTTFSNLGFEGNVSCAQIQPDGRVLIGGNFYIPASPGKTNIARLNTDGKVDDSFTVTANVGESGGNSAVTQIAIQDGKTFIAVKSHLHSAVIYRLMADGALDPTFQASEPFYWVHAISAEPNGSLLVADSGGKVVRLNPDGSLGGKVPISAQWLHCMNVQSDGKIVVGGDLHDVAGLRRVNLARLNGDLTLDQTFNSGAGGADGSLSVAVPLRDGKTLIGGSFTFVRETRRTAIARLNRDGGLDPEFDAKLELRLTGPPPPEGGVSTAHVGRIAVRTDGKIIIAGIFSHIGGVRRSGAALLNPDGTLDASSPLGATEFPTLLLLQPDDRLVLGGGYTGNSWRTNLARLNADGTLDPTFTSSQISPLSINLQPDGKIVATVVNNRTIRLKQNGAIDESFSLASTVDCTNLRIMGFQSGGKMLVDGKSRWCETGLFRVNETGEKDLGFLQHFWETNAESGVSTVLVQPDDKVVVAFHDYAPSVDPILLRLNENGTIDQTFAGGHGIAATNPWQGYTTSASVARQPDGRILVAGTFTTLNGICRWNVARLEGDRPVLDFTPTASGKIAIQWAAHWSGFQLEECDNNLNGWRPVDGVSINKTGSKSIEISASQSAHFFRLRQ